MSFEEKLKQLEAIVKKLESPEMGIDEGVKLFNEGVELSKDCYEALNKTKGQINIIQKELNEIIEKPFKK